MKGSWRSICFDIKGVKQLTKSIVYSMFDRAHAIGNFLGSRGASGFGHCTIGMFVFNATALQSTSLTTKATRLNSSL